MMVVHCTATPLRCPRSRRQPAYRSTRVVEDAAHALGTTVGGRPVGGLSRATASASTRPRTCPSARAAWSPPTTAGLAGTLRRTRLHGMSHDAWRRYLPGGGWRYDVDRARAQGQHDRPAGRHRPGPAAPHSASGSAAARRSRPGTTRSWPGCPGLPFRTGPPVAATPGTSTRSGSEPEATLHRDELAARLAERGIGTSVHFIPLHHLSYCSALTGLRPGALPGADLVFGPAAVAAAAPVAHRRRRRAGVRAAARPTGCAGGRPGLTGKGGPWRPDRTMGPVCVRSSSARARPAARSPGTCAGVPEYGLEPIGFLDDDESVGGVAGLPLLGALDDLGDVLRDHRPDVVVVAIPALPSARVHQLAAIACCLGRDRPLPALVRRRAGARTRGTRHALADIGPPDRPGRDARRQPPARGRSSPASGCWSPGRAARSAASCAARSAGFDPAKLVMLDHDESNLHRLQLEMSGPGAAGRRRHHRRRHPRRRAGWTRSSRQCRPQVVFHAAALKHLPLLEQHPCEGVKSNVLGTENLRRGRAAARRRAVRHDLDGQGRRPDLRARRDQAARRADRQQALRDRPDAGRLGPVRQRAGQPRLPAHGARASRSPGAARSPSPTRT